MKPPKNFYSNLDRRKQGLPELPEATASDAGKIIKVGEDGAYELGTDNGLPSVTSADNNKLLEVRDGTWSLSNQLNYRSVICAAGDRSITTTQNLGYRAIEQNDGTFLFYVYASSALINSAASAANSSAMPLGITRNAVNGSKRYVGFVLNNTSSQLSGYVIESSTGNRYIATVTTNSITLTRTSDIEYFEITASGSSVSLPSGVTFADVYALLQAGVDVKFTSGARVYSVTSFESTNIRAHWFTDLDLTSMEVYVINIASDGTGTVASATFSGS